MTPTIDAQILTLTDRLIEVMGIRAYCAWLADTLTGRGNWTDNAQPKEIITMLTNKLESVEDDDLDTCPECGEYLHVNTKQQQLCLSETCARYRELATLAASAPWTADAGRDAGGEGGR